MDGTIQNYLKRIPSLAAFQWDFFLKDPYTHAVISLASSEGIPKTLPVPLIKICTQLKKGIFLLEDLSSESYPFKHEGMVLHEARIQSHAILVIGYKEEQAPRINLSTRRQAFWRILQDLQVIYALK